VSKVDLATKAVFIDIETTGLDWETDHLLEVGAVAYDLMEETEIGRFQMLVHHGEQWRKVRTGIEAHGLLRMHGESGLLQELNELHEHHPEGWNAHGVVRSLFVWLGTLQDRGALPLRCPVGGAGFDRFDRRWLNALYGQANVEQQLTYWSLDSSAVARYLTACIGTPGPVSIEFDDLRAHRAVDDCVESYRRLVHMRRWLTKLLADEAEVGFDPATIQPVRRSQPVDAPEWTI
jgi:oligoribonuclease (3'-5' exoribonuclease)